METICVGRVLENLVSVISFEMPSYLTGIPRFVVSGPQEFEAAAQAFWKSSNGTTPPNNLLDSGQLGHLVVRVLDTRIVLVESRSTE